VTRRRPRGRWRRRIRVLLLLGVAGWWMAAANPATVSRWVAGVSAWAGRWAVPVGVSAVGAGGVYVGLIAVFLARRRRGDRRLESADAASPAEFEQLVGRLYRSAGCTVRAGGGAGDLGLDVLAVSPAGLRLVTQCKRYGPRNPVGSLEVQAFLGTYRNIHHADVGVFVTTSRFTRAARRLGESQGLVLVDRVLLGRWMAGSWSPVDLSSVAA
jgi:restriction system protein